MTALNSGIAGQATAAPMNTTAMLHDCMTSATAANRTLPASSGDWQLVTTFNDHNGLRTLIAAAAGGVVLCYRGPGSNNVLSRDGPPLPCPDPSARVAGIGSVICGAIGEGSVIAGEISRQVAVLRMTFPNGRTAYARLAGGCFAVIDPDGAAIDDLTHKRDVRIQATDAAGAVLYAGLL
jgi:hypothetical protein